MKYPRIHLAIDNCFASKRWSRPSEWAEVIRSLGLRCVEASADTECDPLHMGSGYIRDWLGEVATETDRNGIRVVNFYSGHGTYATLGLTHTDVRIRDRFHHEWIEALILMAEELGAGAGFFCHAFDRSVLQDAAEYSGMMKELYARFSDLAEFAHTHGNTTIGVEQMYTPHQVPWTIGGAFEMIREVYRSSGRPFYITIDTGHQTAQRKFRRPTESEIRASIGDPGIWLGPERCHAMVEDSSRDPNDSGEWVEAILKTMDAYPYLFSTHEDGDLFRWLERLGCYSPIIHLQQNNGRESSHKPFAARANASGVVSAEKVLEALAASYRREDEPSMPPRCADIYLTLEIFFPTASIDRSILHDLRESVAYWRRFIPEDGLLLDELEDRVRGTAGS